MDTWQAIAVMQGQGSSGLSLRIGGGSGGMPRDLIGR